MPWYQVELRLRPRARGLHLVTDEIVSHLPQLKDIRVGLLNLFIQHTSASLSINENADPDVRGDMERWLNRTMPEKAPYYEHTTEGDDDMPAHLKTAVLGTNVTIPIRNGRLALGTWQGVYLGEHRDAGGARHVVATIWGE
ncbi:MAG TPA: secondary thiamine-phosphate synthase enzyme YjbQ [Polyangia bacterium]|jgi:secondary thiamine-phosphate synthase enzyme|nr:secondary thiamine-phosphate synthase enzyme YjbQ [Polyangia bacterium]